MNPSRCFERIRVVLHRPSHPGNIGAAARAMKTMGLSRLVLVEPRRFPDREADALAVNAADLLAAAKICSSLKQALEGVALAVAWSARGRDLSHAPLEARAAAAETVALAGTSEVALVFGNETAGLANEDVLLCNRLAHIPTVPDFSSLNLAAAVQIVAYEIYLAAGTAARAAQSQPSSKGEFSGRDEIDTRGEIYSKRELATVEQVEHFYAHLESSLGQTDFLEPGKPKRMMERMRRLFGRAGLQREEVNILRGMLTAWDRKGQGGEES
ncbi:MAG: hypothetical protein A3H35_21040 [Betaproteobacteria bacterium RIFCSPLOWO2_02_FULL_62_17]|nr:MAG: hypothetical protein A3H35_21040 [Betaproteobacteria bacterium RIFCSPLOWO2_02_FULL_62_17]